MISRPPLPAGRKRPFSVSKKMENKALAFEQLSDIYGFRIVVENVEDCYRALGLVHTTWSFVPGRIKGLYLHPKTKRLSIQFTPRSLVLQASALNCNCEPCKCMMLPPTGLLPMRFIRKLAAVYQMRLIPMRRFERTIEHLAHATNPEEFLEHTKLELFLDQVFCFTSQRPHHCFTAGRNTHRLCLCSAHRCWQQLYGLQNQRPHHAGDF